MQETNSSHTILVVDDEQFIRDLFTRLLKAGNYDCLTAGSGEEALEILREHNCSLMLSDIHMPEMEGTELLPLARKIDPDLAVIMVTGVDDRDVAIQCLEAGAYGYLVKPLDANEFLINVANALYRRGLEIANKRYNFELETLVEERTEELRKAKEETIITLARVAEFRDDETAQHTERMSYYCHMLAEKIGLPKEQCEQLRQASPLHDIGKIGISDGILRKPGRLTDEEFDAIKEHSQIGYRMLMGAKSDLLQLGASIALTHHEKYDGSGYPKGLAGNEIPIEGRISAICDVFDALTSDRVYKSAAPVEKAVDILKDGRGTHFDPELLDIFLENIESVKVIKAKYADTK
jgi:putative two-component system response regulator